MARVTNKGPELKGRVNNMVFYKYKGIPCVRSYVPHLSKPASPSQKRIRENFKQCSLIYKFLCDNFLAPWKTAATNTRMNGRNLFISHNIHAFQKNDKLPVFERLQFSTGKLLLPTGLCLTPLSGGKWRLTWEYDETNESSSPDDRLYIAELHTDHPYSLLEVEHLTACRKDRAAEFSTNQSLGLETHLYCFWGNAARTAFSPSRYFKGVSAEIAPERTEVSVGRFKNGENVENVENVQNV